MVYLGFDSPLGVMRTFSFVRGSGGGGVQLPNLFLNITKPLEQVDAMNVVIDMVLPAPKHPYFSTE